jgi:hypothetical protein
VTHKILDLEALPPTVKNDVLQSNPCVYKSNEAWRQGLENLKIKHDVDQPNSTDHDVLIRVKAAGVNPVYGSGLGRGKAASSWSILRFRYAKYLAKLSFVVTSYISK